MEDYNHNLLIQHHNRIFEYVMKTFVKKEDVELFYNYEKEIFTTEQKFEQIIYMINGLFFSKIHSVISNVISIDIEVSNIEGFKEIVLENFKLIDISGINVKHISGHFFNASCSYHNNHIMLPQETINISITFPLVKSNSIILVYVTGEKMYKLHKVEPNEVLLSQG